MSPSTKKFISIFLLAAVLTSSLAWGASTLFASRNSVAANPSGNGLDGSAFQNTAPENPRQVSYGAGPQGSNLTDAVASMFARELVETNPQGPQLQEDGSVGVLPPTSTDIGAYLTTNPPSLSAINPPLDISKIQVIDQPSLGEISDYLAAVTQIQSDVTADPMWQNILITATSTAPDWTDPSRSSLTIARDTMYGMKVPAPFLELHKSLLNLFSTTASYSQVAAQDPVAAVALSGQLESILDSQSVQVQQAGQKIQTDMPEVLSQLSPESRFALASLFEIPVAHATVITIDPAHIAATISEWAQWFAVNYKKIALSIALGYLKNTLLEKLADKVVEWAQGEGAPGYVTSWLSHRLNASIRGATNLIAQRTGALCGNGASQGVYGDVIAGALGYSRRGPNQFAQPAGTTNQNSRDCHFLTPEDLVGTKPFQMDRFIGSMRINPWNDLMALGDQAANAADNAAAAAIDEATAGNGYVDSKKYTCDDGSAPAVDVDGSHTCLDGKDAREESVTPGSNKKDIVSKTRLSGFEMITGLNNEELYTTIGVFIAKQLLKFGKDKGIFGDTAGGGSVTVVLPGGSDLKAELTEYARVLEGAKADTEGAKSARGGAANILQNALTSCSQAQQQDIQTRIDRINAAISDLDTKLQNIQRLLDIVQQFQNNPNLHTASDLERQVGSPSAVSAIGATAQSDNKAAEDSVSQAQQTIQACTGATP